MARMRFKCTKCDRSFSMVAHLARHVNAIHKKGRKTAAKKRPKVRRGRGSKQANRARRRARLGVAARQPISEGPALLLAQLQAHHAKLLTQRRSLDSQIEAITRAITAMQGR